ncbi:hypothetical protein [Facilibium subflavum]|uniref:hypothetical protein n=1 Tax=Facilibium subflavum TaxID=2219058 RepID=UPI000E64DF8E|nr:hypothetical protein [Facilibium subflavum]
MPNKNDQKQIDLTLFTKLAGGVLSDWDGEPEDKISELRRLGSDNFTTFTELAKPTSIQGNNKEEKSELEKFFDQIDQKEIEHTSNSDDKKWQFLLNNSNVTKENTKTRQENPQSGLFDQYNNKKENDSITLDDKYQLTGKDVENLAEVAGLKDKLIIMGLDSDNDILALADQIKNKKNLLDQSPNKLGLLLRVENGHWINASITKIDQKFSLDITDSKADEFTIDNAKKRIQDALIKEQKEQNQTAKVFSDYQTVDQVKYNSGQYDNKSYEEYARDQAIKRLHRAYCNYKEKKDFTDGIFQKPEQARKIQNYPGYQVEDANKVEKKKRQQDVETCGFWAFVDIAQKLAGLTENDNLFLSKIKNIKLDSNIKDQNLRGEVFDAWLQSQSNTVDKNTSHKSNQQPSASATYTSLSLPPTEDKVQQWLADLPKTENTSYTYEKNSFQKNNDKFEFTFSKTVADNKKEKFQVKQEGKKTILTSSSAGFDSFIDTAVSFAKKQLHNQIEGLKQKVKNKEGVTNHPIPAVTISLEKDLTKEKYIQALQKFKDAGIKVQLAEDQDEELKKALSEVFSPEKRDLLDMLPFYHNNKQTQTSYNNNMNNRL